MRCCPRLSEPHERCAERGTGTPTAVCGEQPHGGAAEHASSEQTGVLAPVPLYLSRPADLSGVAEADAPESGVQSERGCGLCLTLELACGCWWMRSKVQPMEEGR